jgi:hypothetical protein
MKQDSPEREQLTREAFELERDVFYRRFRDWHFDMPEIVEACPDPAMRERMLKGFWNQDAEKRFAEYQEATAAMSHAELAAHRDYLRAQLVGRPRESVGIDFEKVVFGAGRITPQPSQRQGKDKGIER